MGDKMNFFLHAMDTKSKLLIIDDDRRNIFALNAVLRSKNFDCDSALSAGEGLQKMRHNNYALVLMDMMMPDLDGYEAIEKMKADERLRDIPVIAVTAQAMPGDREKCLAAGASCYISKPVNVDELMSRLQELMNKDV